MCPHTFVKQHFKVSNLLSCFPTLSASPEASRVVDNYLSSNLSSFNFLSWVSPSRRSEPSTREAGPLWQPLFSFSATMFVLHIFEVSPYWHGSPQVSDILAIPSHIENNSQCGILLHRCLYSKPMSLRAHFSWLAHQLFLHRPGQNLLRCNL